MTLKILKLITFVNQFGDNSHLNLHIQNAKAPVDLRKFFWSMKKWPAAAYIYFNYLCFFKCLPHKTLGQEMIVFFWKRKKNVILFLFLQEIVKQRKKKQQQNHCTNKPMAISGCSVYLTHVLHMRAHLHITFTRKNTFTSIVFHTFAHT